MGVIDLNARVKELERLDRSYYPEEFDQLSSQVNSLDGQINGEGGIDDTVTALNTAVNGTGGLDDRVETIETYDTTLETNLKWQRYRFDQVLENEVVSNADLGGCYFEQIRNLVHMHIAITGLTANTVTQIFSIPVNLSAIRPRGFILGSGWSGTYGTDNAPAEFRVLSNGKVSVVSPTTDARVDLFYPMGDFNLPTIDLTPPTPPETPTT